MAISKSTKRPQWIGGALIFSGRPDPTWTVNQKVARQLEEIWASLEPGMVKPPSAPPLGYRGCFLKGVGDREWFAYGGVVTLKTVDGSESREDRERAFEKSLLASAPKGTLAASFLESN